MAENSAENSAENPCDDAAAFPCGDGGGIAAAKKMRKEKPLSGNENGE